MQTLKFIVTFGIGVTLIAAGAALQNKALSDLGEKILK